MTRKRKLALMSLTAIAVLCGTDTLASEEPHLPRPVRTTVVKAEQFAGFTFAGTVQAKVQTSLAFRLVGQLTSRTVDVGDLVKHGEVVAEVDAIALELAVQKALAGLRDAEARRTNAAITERRNRKLAERNLASVADLELAVQGLQSAKAGVVSARATLNKVREQLSYARLTADFDGVVTETRAEVGQTVTAGQPVITVARLGSRDVVVDVPAAQLEDLRLGDRFEVALQLDTRISTTGTLREIGPEADNGTRMHRLKINIDDAAPAFRLGSIVTVTAGESQPKVAMRIPDRAIFKCGQGDCVWVVDPTTLTVGQRRIKVERREPGDQSVRVGGGLSTGEIIAVAGVDQLEQGQKVRLEERSR